MKYLKILLPIALVCLGVGYYLYNKPHQNMESATADLQASASALLTAFEMDEASANTQYLDKVVQVSGVVRSSSRDDAGNVSVVLQTDNEMSGIICQLDELTEHARTDFKPGEQVVFKGKCTGFLMDVVLVRCVEVK